MAATGSLVDSLARVAALTSEDLDLAVPGHSEWDSRRVPMMFVHTREEVLAGTLTGLSRVERIEARAHAAFGDLRGLIAGLPEDALYEHPWGGWGLADVLDHCLRAERRNIEYTAYAARRGEGDPLDLQLSLSLTPDPPRLDAAGWIEKLAAARRDAVDAARALPEEALSRPAAWAASAYPPRDPGTGPARPAVSVEFRLGRLGPHYIEHVIECEKLLGALSLWPVEGRQIARRVSAARAAHELYTDPATLARLDEELARVAAVMSQV